MEGRGAGVEKRNRNNAGNGGAYVSVDDVADGGTGVVHCSGEERDERGVMHVDLIDLVEDLVNQTRVHHVLCLHRNHVFLKQFHVCG